MCRNTIRTTPRDGSRVEEAGTLRTNRGNVRKKALNLPPRNPGDAVREVKLKPGEQVVGPCVPKPRPEWGHPAPGTGQEYYPGPAFPN